MARRPSKTSNEIIQTLTNYQRGALDQQVLDVEVIRSRREELIARFKRNFPNATAQERALFDAEMRGYTKASRLLWDHYKKGMIGKSLPEDVDFRAPAE